MQALCDSSGGHCKRECRKGTRCIAIRDRAEAEATLSLDRGQDVVAVKDTRGDGLFQAETEGCKEGHPMLVQLPSTDQHKTRG